MPDSFLLDFADPSYLVPRGVWRAPVLGPNGEMLIYAADHNHRLISFPWSLLVPVGDNPFTAAEFLKRRLDAEDPVPDTQEPWQSGMSA